MARRLQNRLALAQFKTKRGWEDLTLDTIEPKFEEELRRKGICEGDGLSDSSSSTSDLPYPTKALMSSPLKAPLFSDAIVSSGGSVGHRKRSYLTSFDTIRSSPSKRFRSSPAVHKSFSSSHAAWKDHHQLAQSSPIKPRRQQHFTTSTGPNVSFFAGSRSITDALTSPNYAFRSDEDDDDILPTHSFQVRASPPSTPPPMRSRSKPERRGNNGSSNGNGNNEDGSGTGNPNRNGSGSGSGSGDGAEGKDRNADANENKEGEEGADLLLYLAASPSLPNPRSKTRMDPPSTPPPKNNKLALPSSMMTTPGGGNPFPNTPGIAFDFSDFVHMTPSPAQKPWKTPNALNGSKTPLSVARRRLTFDDIS